MTPICGNKITAPLAVFLWMGKIDNSIFKSLIISNHEMIMITSHNHNHNHAEMLFKLFFFLTSSYIASILQNVQKKG